MSDLGTIGGSYSIGQGVNNSNKVVGYSTYTTQNDHVHAFIWDSISGMLDLGALGGTDSYARDINNNNEVVGEIILTNGITHAFIWDSNNGMKDIGTLGGDFARAEGINNFRQVVGYSTTADGDLHAFLWENDVMIDLNTLIFGSPFTIFRTGRDINDKGQIVGEANFNGEVRAAILSPIPEPATFVLLFWGLLGLIKNIKRFSNK